MRVSSRLDGVVGCQVVAESIGCVGNGGFAVVPGRRAWRDGELAAGAIELAGHQWRMNIIAAVDLFGVSPTLLVHSPAQFSVPFKFALLCDRLAAGHTSAATLPAMVEVVVLKLAS